MHPRPLPGSVIGPRLSRELVQRYTTPQAQRVLQHCETTTLIVEPRRGRYRRLETARIQGIGIDVEYVATCSMHQPRTTNAEHLAELRHVRLHRRLGTARARLPPHGLDDPIRRLGLTRVDKQV